jgi:hypothetical protein
MTALRECFFDAVSGHHSGEAGEGAVVQFPEKMKNIMSKHFVYPNLGWQL